MTDSQPVPAPARPGDSGYGHFLSQLLGDREQFFAEVADGRDLGGKITRSFITLLVLSGFYGVSVGAYPGPAQALSAAIKLPLLFIGTLLICFPGFFVIQVLVGSRLRLAQVLALVAGALALSAIVMAAVVPVALFFLLTGANYYFLELLHVAIVLGSGLVGMAALHEGLAFACEKRGVYPRSAMTIMQGWAVLFAFVGVQMAWNLRPFVGDRGEPFKVFRHYEGNFYTGVIYSLQRLSQGADKGRVPAVVRRVPVDLPGGYRLLTPPGSDSTQAGRP
jgi:hypothetical protein